jgi:hypothetical protein
MCQNEIFPYFYCLFRIADKLRVKKQKDLQVVGLLFLIGSILFVGLYFFWPPDQSDIQGQRKVAEDLNRISVHDPKTQELVSQHMWITTRAQELAEKKARAQNIQLSPQIGQSILPLEKAASPLGIDHSADRNEDNAFEDLNRYRRDIQPNNPDHLIQGRLHDRDKVIAYTQEYQVEYARQFIENARRNGYEVKLNDDYVVVSVRPIRPQGQRLPTANSVPFSNAPAK